MIKEDSELDQMFVQLDKSHPYCGKCLCKMETINPKEFKCPKCGTIYLEK